MANTLALAEIFQSQLDEAMVQSMVSGVLEMNSSQIRYNGGNTVRIPKMSLEGFGTYSRSAGFPAGAVTLSWETHTLTMDRGKSFSLDAMDVDETNFVATASNVLGAFQREKAAVEVDAYRFSKIYAYASTGSKTATYTPAVATIFTQLKYDIGLVQDIVGDTEPLVIFMRRPVCDTLELSTEVTRFVQMDMSVGGVNTKVPSIDGIPILRVPTARFKTAYTFSATDGFTVTGGAVNMNWIIIAKRSAFAIVKTDKVRIFEPGVNQTMDAWQIDLRKYHDIFIPDNKLDGIWVSYYG